MKKELNQAIILRQEGKLRESNILLLKMLENNPDDALIHYQCAWSFDILGEESKAVPYYEDAIELGLPDGDLQGALLGLGSTYRTLGEYEKSKNVFVKAVELFPRNRAIQVFYSMTLYNLNEHSQAMELLIKCLVDTTSDKEIMNYERAIRFYSDKLNEVWE